MAVVQNTYTGDGVTVLYSLSFPYLDRSDVKVSVNGTIVTNYIFATDTSIQFLAAPGAGASIRIYRDTDNEETKATIFPGSAIKAQDLNANFSQTLYAVQEIAFRALSKFGDTMLGILNMGGFKITNLGTPTSSTDASTKAYVDGLISTGAANAAAAAASASAAAGSASSAAASYDAFDDRYLGSKPTDPALDNDGNALITGAIYFNTSSNVMRVYNGATWQDASANANVLRWRKTAVGGETSLSGADDNAATLTYTVNLEFVYLNGVLLTRGVDYTASNGTSITGLVALEAGDIVEVLSYSSFSLVNVPGSTIQDGTISTQKFAPGAVVGASFTQTGTGAVARTINSKLKDVVSVKDFGAVGDGIANDTTAIQTALNYIRDNGGTLEFPYGTYTVNAQLTLQRSSSGHTKRWVIQGNGSTIQSSYTTAEIMVVGATNFSFFVEDGGIVIRDLFIVGSETTSGSSGASPTYTQTGLYLYCAGNVLLQNVQTLKCRTGIRTHACFPLKAIDCSGRGCWIGVHLDETSNLQDWDNLATPNCRYGVLIYSSTTSFDGGKSNNITFRKWWSEGCNVGMTIDSGTGGSGNTRFRSISVIEPYIGSTTYDIIRLALQYNFATPAIRGSACSEFITDLRFSDGLWNNTYSATSSALVFDNNNRVRQCYVDVPIPSLDITATSWLNSPSGGTIVARGLPQTAQEGRTTSYIYNQSGTLVQKIDYTGTVQFSASQGVSFGNETLNSYDEGVFTPTIVGNTTSGTATYSVQTGRFTRIGNRVFFDIGISWSGHTGTGSMRIGGLPVTPNTSTTSSVYFGFVESIVLGAGNYLTGYVRSDGPQITLLTANLGTSVPTVPSVSAAGGLRCSGHYDV